MLLIMVIRLNIWLRLMAGSNISIIGKKDMTKVLKIIRKPLKIQLKVV